MAASSTIEIPVYGIMERAPYKIEMPKIVDATVYLKDAGLLFHRDHLDKAADGQTEKRPC